MNAEYEHHLSLMKALTDRMARLPEEMREFNRDLRKSKRGDLARAKRIAWALRHTLTRVAGHTLVIGSEHVERWIATYLAFCIKLHVTPPAVRVPRSMQHKLGKLIGGPPPPRSLWDDYQLDYSAILAATSGVVLSVTEKAAP